MAHFFKGVFSKIGGLQNKSFMIASRRMIAEQVMPTNMQRRILVWTKFYPDVESVPKNVNRSQLKKALDLFRIRVNIMMMVATVGGIIGVVVYVKLMKESGDSLQRRGLEDIRRWREKAQKGE